MRGSKIGWVQDEVDGVLYDPIPPCDYMLLPEPSEVREHADEAMAAAAVLRPGSDVFDARAGSSRRSCPTPG